MREYGEERCRKYIENDSSLFWQDIKESKRKAKERNLDRNLEGMVTSEWTEHTPYHWTKVIRREKVHFYPSTNKFVYRKKVRYGGIKVVNRFIKSLQGAI